MFRYIEQLWRDSVWIINGDKVGGNEAVQLSQRPAVRAKSRGPSCLSLPLYSSKMEACMDWRVTGTGQGAGSWWRGWCSSFLDPAWPLGWVHNCLLYQKRLQLS